MRDFAFVRPAGAVLLAALLWGCPGDTSVGPDTTADIDAVADAVSATDTGDATDAASADAPPTTSCETSADCIDDEDWCNGQPICVDGTCQNDPATVPDCNSADRGWGPCSIGVCVPEGGCQSEPVADGTACGDGDLCLAGGTCNQGNCEAGGALCDDGNPCTVDECDPAAPGFDPGDPQSACSFIPEDTLECDDGDACATEACIDGECVTVNAVTCSPGGPCIDAGVCDPATGICSVPTPFAEGTPCDDGDACTDNDACDAGSQCAGSAKACELPTGCQQSGACDPGTGECVFTDFPDGISCDDGDPCTDNDSCVGGLCSAGPPIDCSTDEPCKVAVCDSVNGGCVIQDDDTAACDDGNPCTADACVDGVCVGTPTEGAPCLEDNLCVTGVCQSGVCEVVDQVECPWDQSAVCAVFNYCDPQTGQCVQQASAVNGDPCDDDSACTTDDACLNGQCLGAAVPCNSPPPAVCSASGQAIEGFEAFGSCNTGTGECAYAPTTTNCALGCNGGVCIEVTSCVDGVDDGKSCDDGDACTTGDVCAGGTCAGMAVVCEAQDLCSLAGTCSPSTGECSHPPVVCDAPPADACANGGTAVERFEAVGTCALGDGQCSYASVVTECASGSCTGGVCDPVCNGAGDVGDPCDDEDPCTMNDVCDSFGTSCAGTPMDCSALDSECGVGQCDAGQCVVSPINEAQACAVGSLCLSNATCSNGVCEGTPTCDNGGNPCLEPVCNASDGSCSTAPVADGTVCDPQGCTSTGICEAGACTNIYGDEDDEPANDAYPGVSGTNSTDCSTLVGSTEGYLDEDDIDIIQFDTADTWGPVCDMEPRVRFINYSLGGAAEVCAYFDFDSCDGADFFPGFDAANVTCTGDGTAATGFGKGCCATVGVGQEVDIRLKSTCASLDFFNDLSGTTTIVVSSPETTEGACGRYFLAWGDS